MFHISGLSTLPQETPEQDVYRTTLRLRRELLRVVLRDTFNKNGVPSSWVAGETLPTLSKDGQPALEIRLIVQCYEPRFLGYLAAFQADFESRLFAIEPQAHEWVSGVAWLINAKPDHPDDELPLPSTDYWRGVLDDREFEARKRGDSKWSREELERHFESTKPGEFADTHPSGY